MSNHILHQFDESWISDLTACSHGQDEAELRRALGERASRRARANSKNRAGRRRPLFFAALLASLSFSLGYSFHSHFSVTDLEQKARSVESQYLRTPPDGHTSK
jgi:hypothetical protein